MKTSALFTRFWKQVGLGILLATWATLGVSSAQTPESQLKPRWFAPEKTETQEEFFARISPLMREALEQLPNIQRWEKRNLYTLAYELNKKDGTASFRPEKPTYSDSEKDLAVKQLDEKLELLKKYTEIFGFIPPREKNDFLRELTNVFGVFLEIHNIDYEVRFQGRGMISLRILPGATDSKFHQLLHDLDKNFMSLKLEFNPWATEPQRVGGYLDSENVIFLSARVLRQLNPKHNVLQHELRHAKNALFPTEKTILGITTGKLEKLYPDTYNGTFPHDEVDTYTLQMELYIEELDQALANGETEGATFVMNQLFYTVLNGLTVSRRLVNLAKHLETSDLSKAVFEADERNRTTGVLEFSVPGSDIAFKTRIPLVKSKSPEDVNNSQLLKEQLKRYGEKGGIFENQFLMARPLLDQLTDCTDPEKSRLIVQSLRERISSSAKILE